MKGLKKFFTLILTMCIFGVNMMPVFADSYKLNVEKESADIKYLENDQGNISKKIINSDSEKGEVTVELSVSNSKSVTSNVPEIIFVVDNSSSMEDVTSSGKTRNEESLVALKSLVNSIYNDIPNAKIGLVKFAGMASKVQTLTNNSSDVLKSIDLFQELTYFSGTNVMSGLEVANEIFSENTSSKTIILLTDGLPTRSTTGISGVSGYTVNDVYKDTKTMMANVANSTNFITVLTGVSSDSDQSIVSNVFGTSESPVSDKLYNIDDSQLNKVITQDVLSIIKQYIQPSISNVILTDYFPSDIKDNFEFSYVTKPTSGTISEAIGEDSSIKYTLNELKANESIKIAYKLKLKDMSNTALLDKVISTNEKVVLNYTDSSNTNKEVVLTSSPSIKLTKVEEEPKEEAPVDEEFIEDKEEVVENPPTGLYISVGVIVATILGLFGFVTLRKKNYFSKI